MKYQDLHHLATNSLIEWLPAGIKEHIDERLSAGDRRQDIWYRYQLVMRAKGVSSWQTTYLAIHAYLWPEQTQVPDYPC